MLKILSTKSAKLRKDIVRVGSGSKARCDKNKLNKSGINNNKVNGSEVKDNEVGIKV